MATWAQAKFDAPARRPSRGMSARLATTLTLAAITIPSIQVCAARLHMEDPASPAARGQVDVPASPSVPTQADSTSSGTAPQAAPDSSTAPTETDAAPAGTLSQTALGRAFPEAEAIFHKDPRWLGADAALSIPLGRDRILWLFGDTFIAKSRAYSRKQSEMVRNTIAIQQGSDLRTASIKFYWGLDRDGTPGSFFPEQGERWFWPGHGIRLDDGPLIIFLYGIVETPGENLGFASARYAVAIIDDPDAPAETWRPLIVEGGSSAFDASPATAVVRDGDWIVAVAIRQEGTHAGALVRWPADELARGDLSGAEWWAGEPRGWVAEAALGPDGPAFVIDDAGSECSLHWDARVEAFVHIASYGFGATTIGLRTAPALTGPWSRQILVYHPPESDGRRPFVYAAKGHPELIGPDAADLVVTYAANSFEFGDLFSPEGQRSLYWPRFVAVPLGPVLEAAAAASVQLLLPPALEPERADLLKAIDQAVAEVVAWFAAAGFRLDPSELIDTAIVYRSSGIARRACAEHWSLKLEDIPETFAGTVDGKTLLLVSPDAFLPIWMRLYPNWPYDEESYPSLIRHELAHRAHALIAVSLTGSEEGMGPRWFYEGLAILCARQFEGKGATGTEWLTGGAPGPDQNGGRDFIHSPLSWGELLSYVAEDQEKMLSFPIYGAMMHALAARFPMRQLIERAGTEGFLDWMATGSAVERPGEQ
jgi:hypothetical protein